jgi:putative inorganic carbon (HCO3(-)) transporter
MPSLKTAKMFDAFYVTAVLCLAPVFLFPSPRYAVAFFMILIFLFLRTFMGGSFIPRTPLDMALLILLVQILISCIIVPDLSFSRGKIAGSTYGIILFYSLVGLLNQEKWINWSLKAFLAIGLIFTIIGVLGLNYYWVYSKYGFRGVLKDEFGGLIKTLSEHIPKVNWRMPGAEEGVNPNPLAGTILLFVCFGMVLFYFSLRGKLGGFYKKKKSVIFFVVLFICVIQVASLFITQSYGAWMGFLLAMAFMILSRKKKILGALLISGGIVLSIILVLRPPLVGPGWKNIKIEKISARIALWNAGLQIIQQYPITGIGMNRIRLEKQVGYDMSHVHNQLLHLAAELGIPALIAYLAILINMARMVNAVKKKTGPAWMKYAVQGLAAGQLAYFIFGMTDAVPLGAKPGIFFWISLALITSIHNYFVTVLPLENGIEKAAKPS